MSGSHKVILSAQSGIQLDILKGSGNTEFSQLIRSHSGDSLTVIVDFALLGFIEAVYAIEESGLASAIRSDNSQYLVIPDIHTHVNQGSDATEAKGEAVNA